MRWKFAVTANACGRGKWKSGKSGKMGKWENAAGPVVETYAITIAHRWRKCSAGWRITRILPFICPYLPSSPRRTRILGTENGFLCWGVGFLGALPHHGCWQCELNRRLYLPVSPCCAVIYFRTSVCEYACVRVCVRQCQYGKDNNAAQFRQSSSCQNKVWLLIIYDVTDFSGLRIIILLSCHCRIYIFYLLLMLNVLTDLQ